MSAMERAIVEDALAELGDAVKTSALEGSVTRSAISQACRGAASRVSLIGHGEFREEDGYLVLNAEDGAQEDLIAARSFAGFFRDYRSMKLVVLNSCQGAAVASTRPLAGIAPQLVRAGHSGRRGNAVSVRGQRCRAVRPRVLPQALYGFESWPSRCGGGSRQEPAADGLR